METLPVVVEVRPCAGKAMCDDCDRPCADEYLVVCRDGCLYPVFMCGPCIIRANMAGEARNGVLLCDCLMPSH